MQQCTDEMKQNNLMGLKALKTDQMTENKDGGWWNDVGCEGASSAYICDGPVVPGINTVNVSTQFLNYNQSKL